MSRIRTTIELSKENLILWRSLPQGEGKRLINFLLDEVRKLKTEEGDSSIHNFLAKVIARNIKIVE